MDIAAISTGLHLEADGIWYANAVTDVSYPDGGNQECFEIEDRSFWFRHRNACISAAVRQFPPAPGGPIVDIGGGNGFVALALARGGFPVVLLEPGPGGARNARRRGLSHVICATLETAGFRAGSLPAAGVFDVVEHIRDDGAFLSLLHGLLQPGGLLYLTVPAASWLWSPDDVQAGHHRRYSSSSLRATLEAAGYRVRFLTHLFAVLPPPIFLFRTLPGLLPGRPRGRKPLRRVAGDHAVGGGSTTRILDRLLSWELDRLQARRPLGFGSSCLAVAEAV